MFLYAFGVERSATKKAYKTASD